jgi:pimeloyl-ACP methyl ester carboxylesterase
MDATTYDIRRLAHRIDETRAWAIATRPGIRIVELPSTNVRVRVAGAGPRVVFACDPPNVIEQYDEVVERLARDFTVIVFEQPGFGFSFPKPGWTFTRREFADALRELLEVLDMAPYALAFPCVSTYYGMQVAHDHPALVDRLILMQAAAWREQRRWIRRVARLFTLVTLGVPLFGDRIFSTPYVGQMLGAVLEPSFPRRTHRFAVHRGFFRRDIKAKFIDPGDRAFRNGACNCMPSLLQRYVLEEDLPFTTLSQPAVILWGAADLTHRGTDRAGLTTHVPAARVITIPDTGHHLELENPEAICREIRAFLSSR